MNNNLLIIIIFFILITFLLGQYFEKYSNIKIIREYIKNTENERNITMNGIDIKYYINFSFHYKLFNLFEIVTKKLDEKKINYFIIGGGLIGYFRHNQGLIPWDDDIDIGIMEEDKSKLHETIKELIKENNKIELIIHDLDKVVYDKFNQNPIQIDIFYFKYFPEQKYYFFNVELHRKLWPKHYFYTEEIYPLQKVPFKLYAPDGTIYKEIKVIIPNQSEKYLDRAYKNWQTVKTATHSHSNYYKLLFS